MHRGYVKLWRKGLEGDLIANARAWQLMCWCLLRAAYRPRKALVGGAVVELLPGQLIAGRQSLARELKTTERKIRTALDLLARWGFLTTRATNRFTLITITNWHVYQDDKGTAAQPEARRRPAPDPPTATNKEGKEEENNIPWPGPGSEPGPEPWPGPWQKPGPGPEPEPWPGPKPGPEPGKPAAGQEGRASFSLSDRPEPGVFITLPTNRKDEHYPVRTREAEEWRHLYPAVDVAQALRSMRGWLLGNPRRRKTGQGMSRFIHNWLAREQDKVRGHPGEGLGLGAGANVINPLTQEFLPLASPAMSPEERARKDAESLELFRRLARLNEQKNRQLPPPGA